MDEQENSKTTIMMTYTLYRSGKDQLIQALKNDLFELQYQTSYLKAVLDKELEENPESLSIGKSLQIDINTLRIKEVKEMLKRMHPKK